MTPFLYRIAQAFYKKYGNEISRLAFVFPNRRSGIFFQKYLAEVSGKPIFSPKVTTINDLMAELSPYTLIDRMEYSIGRSNSSSGRTMAVLMAFSGDK